jgi:3-hydroxyisobutyrate dehydrogenase
MTGSRTTVALLGTGAMGTPMARNLLAAGFEVWVWNRTVAHAAPLADAGASLADSPAGAATDADVVITMLADGPAVEAAMRGAVVGAADAMRADAVWVQMSTVGTAWTDRLAALADERGLTFVDAPVSGSTGPAEAGELLVLASGPDGARDRVQAVFDALGRSTLWLGPAGNGSRLKLALNNWLAFLVEGAAETIALTEAMGLDPRVLVDAIGNSPLGSPFAVAKARLMVEHDYAPTFALRLALKDAGLALDAGHEHGVELPVTEALVQRWREAVSSGHGDEDVAVVGETARQSEKVHVTSMAVR